MLLISVGFVDTSLTYLYWCVAPVLLSLSLPKLHHVRCKNWSGGCTLKKNNCKVWFKVIVTFYLLVH